MTPFANVLAALILAASPVELASKVEVSVIELNSMYDSNGAHLMDQWLFWRWNGDMGRHEISEWRIDKPSATFALRKTDGGCEVSFLDGGQRRLVHAVGFKRSWTQHDPEIADRQVCPQEYRVPLFEGGR